MRYKAFELTRVGDADRESYGVAPYEKESGPTEERGVGCSQPG